MTASELYAKAHGQSCKGEHPCYYCGVPCTQMYRHNQPAGPAVLLGAQRVLPRWNSQWMCIGCHMFRRPSTTIFWLNPESGKYDDRQCPANHSWLINENAALAVRPNDATVYEALLSPTYPFALLLRTTSYTEQVSLHLAPVNEAPGKDGEGTIKYLLDNQVFEFSGRELRVALEHGKLEGKSGGVRALVNFFGSSQRLRKKVGPGRPKADPERTTE